MDVDGRRQSVALPAGSLAFTFCQTPVVYRQGERPQLTVEYAAGHTTTISGNRLDREGSRHIFDRKGVIRLLQVTVTC